MKLLARLAGLLNRRRPVLSVSVYLRAGSYFIDTIHGSDGSDPCIAAGPVEAIALATPHQDLGNAVLRGLQRTTHNFPYPANQAQWREVIAPLLSTAGCKTWSAFARRASSLRVDQDGEQFSVLPCIREKSSFAPVPDRELQLKAPSAQDLGEVVARELAFAASRDDG